MELHNETTLTSTSNVASIVVAVEEDFANIAPAPDEKAPQLTQEQSHSVFTNPVVSS